MRRVLYVKYVIFILVRKCYRVNYGATVLHMCCSPKVPRYQIEALTVEIRRSTSVISSLPWTRRGGGVNFISVLR